MRKSLLLLATLAPLAAFAGLASFTLPASAESEGGSCAALPAPGPLDLEAIPAKPVSGPLSVRGVGGDDECEGEGGASVGGIHALAAIGSGDQGDSDEGFGESDD